MVVACGTQLVLQAQRVQTCGVRVVLLELFWVYLLVTVDGGQDHCKPFDDPLVESSDVAECGDVREGAAGGVAIVCRSCPFSHLVNRQSPILLRISVCTYFFSTAECRLVCSGVGVKLQV